MKESGQILRSLIPSQPAALLRAVLLLALCAPAQAGIIYLSDGSNVPVHLRYGSLDTSNNSFDLISTAPPYYFGLAYSASGVLYAIDNNFHLDIINSSTGAVTQTIGSNTYVGALSSPIAGGTLYEVSSTGDLFEINPTTGGQTLIGALGISVPSDYATAFGPDGNLYLETTTGFSVPTGTSELYEINLSNGHATQIGQTEERITAMVGLDSGLAGFVATSADGSIPCIGCQEELVGIDTANGAVTSVLATLPQPYSGGSQVQGAVEEVGSGAPEPGGFSLALGAVLGIAALCRWKGRE